MNIPKFRAWDKVNKKMIDCEDILSICFRGKEISIEHVGIFDENAIPHIRTTTFKLEDIELMQSASLKDDLLNDIFVGDIVCVDGEIAKVIFEDGVMMVEDEYGSRENLCDCSPIEVFGNIYENPEFLEGVKQ